MNSDTNTASTGIKQVNERFMSAFAKQTAGDVASLYTDDAQVLPPSGAAVTGKDGIAQFWAGAMHNGISRVELNTLELDGAGDKAIEIGRAQLFKGTGEIVGRVKYLVVWKNQDGDWKLHRDIWNDEET